MWCSLLDGSVVECVFVPVRCYTIPLCTRGKTASYPTTWSLPTALWSRLSCAVLWCPAGLDSPKHLGKPCSTIPGQSLPLENPGTARLPFHVTLQCESIHYNAMHWIIQYGLLHFSLLRYSHTSCEAKCNIRMQKRVQWSRHGCMALVDLITNIKVGCSASVKQKVRLDKIIKVSYTTPISIHLVWRNSSG